jgi:hypothetical protein
MEGTGKKGIAVTIGLNSVDPHHYEGWSGELNACEADAEDMAAIAKTAGFQVNTLLTKEATRDKVISAISNAATELTSGSIFMLSYSGHGGHLPDLNSDEIDGQDETWCLYDGQIVDDELNNLYSRFSPGVRVLIFSDSCHSGTITKAAYYRNSARSATPESAELASRYRFMPSDVALRVYRKNREFYDRVLGEQATTKLTDVVASILLVSGCQDNQYSIDGEFNGLFTGTLLKVWREGSFKGNYMDFHRAIQSRMPPDQSSNLYLTGQVDYQYLGERPFTI